MKRFYQKMIVKTSNGKYIIKSEKGKNLSKPFRKKSDAQKRLREIEYFKNKGE